MKKIVFGIVSSTARNLGLLAFVFALAVQAFALEIFVKDLVFHETRSNAVAQRSDAAVRMPHYEIPLRLVDSDFASNLDEKIKSALVFEKNGEPYVRWIANPEDTKWFRDVESFLKKNGLPSDRRYLFTGYMTASRSYIVEHPVSKVQFSVKASTNVTGGNWKDKKQEYKDAFDIRMISDFVQDVQDRIGFDHLIIMYEPAVLGIKDIDQSVVVRELAGLEKGEFKYIPGFSVLHETVGREIAEKNGSRDPARFWQEHYVAPLARAAAELFTKTGIWLDSPHSQNFLIELDKNDRPTGKIVLRDLGDIYIHRPTLAALGREDITKRFSEKKNIINYAMLSFGPLHGNIPPSWVNTIDYSQWGVEFKRSFWREFSARTQIRPATMSARWSEMPFSYFTISFETQGNISYDQYLRQYAQKFKSAGDAIRACRFVHLGR
jgi:hypothetical protein